MTAEITPKSHGCFQLVTLVRKNAPQNSLFEIPWNALKYCPLAKELGNKFVCVPQDRKPIEPIRNASVKHIWEDMFGLQSMLQCCISQLTLMEVCDNMCIRTNRQCYTLFCFYLFLVDFKFFIGKPSHTSAACCKTDQKYLD